MSGFAPVGTTDGSDYHGKMQDLLLDDGADVFIGDIVDLDTTNAAATDTTLRASKAAAATGSHYGAVVEFFPNFNDEGTLIKNYHENGDGDQSIRVVFGSVVVFAGADDGTLDGTDIGSPFDFIDNGGDTITGISGEIVDGAGGAGVDLTVIGLANFPGNDWGNTDGARVLCTLL